MNRNVLSLFLKVEMLSVSSVTSVGRLFQRDGPVVAKHRSPIVFSLERGTTSFPGPRFAVFRSRWSAGLSDLCSSISARYDGASPCRMAQGPLNAPLIMQCNVMYANNKSCGRIQHRLKQLQTVTGQLMKGTITP